MLRRLCAFFCLASCLVATGPAQAEVYDDSTGQFRIWIPDDMPVVYGFYVSFNSSGDDNRTMATRVAYQAYARTLGFGIIGTDIEEPGDPDALLDAMTEFATASGHSEVADAPVVVEGVSLGGYLAMEFAAAHPSRTIACLAGAQRQLVDVSGNAGFNALPTLFHQGETDGDWTARRDEYLTIRDRGAKLGFWVQWGFDHGRWFGDKVGWRFIDDAVALRYPTNQSPIDGPIDLIDIPEEYGYLIDPTTWQSGFTEIYAWDDYPGDRSQAFWVPTREVAFLVRANATEDPPLTWTTPDNWEFWQSAEPGDAVALAIDAGGLTGIEQIEFFVNATSLAVVDGPPWTATWNVPGDALGHHGITAVATLTGGDRRTSWTLPFVIPGEGTPGSGLLENPPDRPDAGPGDPGDPGDSADAGTGPGADGGDAGGCGCHHGPLHAGDLGGALLLLVGLGWALRRRRRG